MTGNDIREGKRSVLVVHCLESVPAQESAWLKEVLDKPRSRTTAQDIAEVRAMFERSDSLAFALNELARRRPCGPPMWKRSLPTRLCVKFSTKPAASSYSPSFRSSRLSHGQFKRNPVTHQNN